jgi:isopenicillin N synthase-like dioxygenase
VANAVPAQLADFYDPNAWPAEVPALRTAVRQLSEHSRALGGQVMRLFAVALGLGDGAFDPYLEPNASLFAINHYPPAGSATVEEQPLLFAEHSDGNTLTILHQRGDFEGLQVQRLDAASEWIPVPVREDAFVINFGELMTRWTNDHWPATRHRVVASSDPAATRTTLATFHMPALETVIAPLAAWTEDGGAHYEPVTAYDWEFRHIRARYSEATDATGLRQSDRTAHFARRLGA